MFTIAIILTILSMFFVGWLLWIKSHHLDRFKWLILLVFIYLAFFHARNLWIVANHDVLERELGMLLMCLAVSTTVYHFLV